MIQAETVVYIRDTRITAPTQIAGIIQGSYVILESSSTTPELADAVDKLGRAIVDAAKQAPADVGEGLSRDFQSLTTELAAPAPRPRTMRFAIDSIKEAAIRLGPIGVSLVGLAANINSLLSG